MLGHMYLAKCFEIYLKKWNTLYATYFSQTYHDHNIDEFCLKIYWSDRQWNNLLLFPQLKQSFKPILWPNNQSIDIIGFSTKF